MAECSGPSVVAGDIGIDFCSLTQVKAKGKYPSMSRVLVSWSLRTGCEDLVPGPQLCSSLWDGYRLRNRQCLFFVCLFPLL